jgi:hypothetical protein
MKGFIKVNAKRANSGFVGKAYQQIILATQSISSITPRGTDHCLIQLTEIGDVDEHGNAYQKIFEADTSVEAVGQLLEEAH